MAEQNEKVDEPKVEAVEVNKEGKQEEHSYGKEFKSKFFPKFKEELPSSEGKNVVITGTTSGTGLVAARTALEKGATVALLNRNVEKAKKALQEFFEATEGASERAHFVQCDLQDFESVREAAETVSKLFEEGIDVICNNAGVMALEDVATKDGYDVQMQTNHLSHFMLTSILFPLLHKRAEETGEARVVNHSSSARLGVSSLKKKYFGKNSGKLGGNGNNMLTGARWERYHQTKLANSVFTCELHKRCKAAQSKVISLCAHPGLAATNLQLTTAKEGGLSGVGFMNRAQSQEDGAMGILKCMFDPTVKPGSLYGPMILTGKATKRYHGILSTAAAGKMLWNESEKVCGPFEIIKAEAPVVEEKEEAEEEEDEVAELDSAEKAAVEGDDVKEVETKE